MLIVSDASCGIGRGEYNVEGSVLTPSTRMEDGNLDRWGKPRLRLGPRIVQTLSSIIPYGIGRRVKNAVHLAVRPVAFPSALEKAEVENSNSNGGSGCRGLTAAVRAGGRGNWNMDMGNSFLLGV